MASRASLLLLLIYLCCVVEVAWSGCSNVTALSAQLDAALAEYEREAAPAQRVRVQLALDVRHAALDDRTNSMRLLADLHMNWQDSRLAWNASEWGCEWCLAAAERLWLPDVTLLNAAQASAGSEPLRARLASAGAVSWADRLDVSIPVAMDLADWPNDVQEGVFKFASRAHSSDEIELVIKDGQYATVWETGAWEILSVSGVVTPAARPGARREAAWTLRVRRRAPAQALAARGALAAALLLLLAAVLLPPDSRGPLAAAATFTIALWLCVSAWRVPGGASAPRGVSLAGAVCALGAACAAGAALSVRAAARALPPPHALRTALAAVAVYWPRLTQDEGGTGGAGGPWAGLARLLDAALLAALGLALLVMLCVYL